MKPPLSTFNTVRLRQNYSQFADGIFKCFFLNENIWILINIWLKFVLKGWTNNISALVQIMAWHSPGNKPLSELIHIWVTRPQWVNTLRWGWNRQHFTDDIFKHIFFNENVWISIIVSLKFVPKGLINNNPSILWMMAWCLTGNKPLSGPTMA